MLNEEPIRRKRRKKCGRKRKRRRKLPPKSKANNFKYYIILTKDKVQYETITKSVKASTIIEKYNNLISQNQKEVIFPIRYLNSRKLTKVNYEIVILKQKDDNDIGQVKFRNEYGMYVPTNTIKMGLKNNIESYKEKEWIIYNKHEWNYEETFWVYGFNPQIHRKTFSFIYDTFITERFKNNPLAFLRIIVYKNKLIIDHGEDLDFVICKNKEDAVRLYNAIEEKCNKEKYKRIMWCGESIGRNNAIYWIDKIQKKTNWDRKKISRNSLRP